MAIETRTRADLSETVVRTLGISKEDSRRFVDAILEEMTMALCRDEKVKISSFGSFSVRRKNSRIGRNPKTGEQAVISPRKVTLFRASPTLKWRITNNLIDS